MNRLSLIAALTAGLAAVPAQAKVVELKDDAFVTRDSVLVSASTRETWLALISPAKWWNEAHTFSGDKANLTLMPKAGGCYCERMPGKDTAENIGLDGSVEHMRVVLAIPDQALRMTGSLGPLQSEPVTAILTVTMTGTKEGSTRIVFEYAVGGYMRYKSADISKAVDGVITGQMLGLAKLLGPLDGAEEESEAKDEAEKVTDAEDDVEESAADADEDQKPEPKAEKAAPKLSVDEAFGDLTKDD